VDVTVTTNGGTSATSSADQFTYIAPPPSQNPAMTITKTPNPLTYSASGQTITYTYTVKNTGNVELNAVKVVDSMLGQITLLSTDLAPNAQTTGTATYKTTVADMTAGSVSNTATVYNGTQQLNQTTAKVTAPPPSQNPAMTITKTPNPLTYSASGQTITYTYTVKNTGNVNILEPITVHDNKILGGQITIGTSDGVLAVGQSITGTATYTITQADMDTGFVTNSAFATNNIINSNNTSITVLAVQKPGLKIDKDVDPKTYFTVGDTIDYLFTVTNKGNVDIAGPITVTDSMFGSKQISSNGLAPGQSVTRGKSYLITPQDIENGIVINSAFATGSFNDKKVTSDTDKAIAKFFGPTANL
jgi:uncharacterized repeat protein (TIGR01451 family)